jgi:hypothetical protein
LATTLAILLDAFPITYISEGTTPFLYGMSKREFATHLRPMFAFRGIETTVFTGEWPDIHGTWTEWCIRRPETSLTENTAHKIIQLTELFPGERTKVASRYVVDRFFSCTSNSLVRPNLIPAKLLRHFHLSQHCTIFEPKALGNVPTLFDILRQKDLNYVCSLPSTMGGDESAVKKIFKFANSNQYFHFWFLKLGLLDRLGHSYGPNKKALTKALRLTDHRIETIVNRVRKIGDVNVLVFADHGMSLVRGRIDVLDMLKQLDSRIIKDYIVFLDSTMARFWFFSERSREEIEGLFENLNSGHFLSSEEKKFLRISRDPRYGELIFVLDEGYVIHPDFFHRSRIVKGMHGYAYPRSKETLPLLIVPKKIAESFDLSDGSSFTDIFQIILKSCEINL